MITRPGGSTRAWIAALALLVAVGCSSTEPDVDEAVGSVSVSPSSATIDVGATATLTAEVRNQDGAPINRSVSWSSASDATATVSTSGVVSGQAPGTVTITASAGNRSGTAQVTVVEPLPPVSPSGVQATALSDVSAQVTWNDESANEDEFLVERLEVGSSDQVFREAGRVPANTTGFEDDDLEPATGYRYRVRACNGLGCSAAAGGTGASEITTFETLAIQTSSLPVGSVGVAYQQQLQASGGDGSVAWSISDGALPAGLTLSSEGVIGGTPSVEGTFDFTVRAFGAGQARTRALSISIVAGVLITTADLPTGITGVFYTQTLSATGGTGSYLWTLVGGTMPSGFTLQAPNGTIAGTPSSPSVSTFTVQASSGGLTDTREFTILVYNPLAINTTSLAVAKVGNFYSQPVTAGGGDGTNVWSLDSGALPAGLAVSTTGTGTGLISGTPTEAGSFSVTLRVTSGDLQTAVRTFTLTVNP
jgi:large repetitive protein